MSRTYINCINLYAVNCFQFACGIGYPCDTVQLWTPLVCMLTSDSKGNTVPKLIKLYIRHVAIGFAIAAAFVAMLKWFNVMNLWHLISTSDVGLMALLVLWFAHGIVFAGVQFGWAVMELAEHPPRGGGTKIGALQPVPATNHKHNARPSDT